MNLHTINSVLRAKTYKFRTVVTGTQINMLELECIPNEFKLGIKYAANYIVLLSHINGEIRKCQKQYTNQNLSQYNYNGPTPQRIEILFRYIRRIKADLKHLIETRTNTYRMDNKIKVANQIFIDTLIGESPYHTIQYGRANHSLLRVDQAEDKFRIFLTHYPSF